MFPIPRTIYHIVMLICTAASLGISNKNEHYVIASSYSFKTTQTPNTFHFKDHKTALFQQITIQQSALNKIALWGVASLGRDFPLRTESLHGINEDILKQISFSIL